MSADAPTPQPSRITPELCARLVAHYARLQGLAAWGFSVEVVAGLTDPRSGGDAWALVVPDPRGRTARVQVRDIDATPIPGFDGDPMREIRVTISHELWHCAVAEYMADPTIDAEERLVETAAQAVVTSEGTGDARILARSVRAIPAGLRARIAARAPLARGGPMDPKMIMEALEALIGGDAEKCQEILKGLIASAAGGGAAPPADGAPPSDAEPAAKVEPSPQPGGADGGQPPPAEDARRAKGAEMGDKEYARARKAALDGEAEINRALALIRPAAKTQIIAGLRARLGSALTPAAEAEIMAAEDTATAEKYAGFAEKLLASGSPQRARSGVEHAQNPGPEFPGAPKTVSKEELLAEGHQPSWVNGYLQIAKGDPMQGLAYLEQGRTALRARKANGAAS